MAPRTPRKQSHPDAGTYKSARIDLISLEPMDVDGEKASRLVELPSLRPLEFRSVHGLLDVKHLGRGCRSTAGWMYTQGDKVEPCQSCQLGHGPFKICVVVSVGKTLPFGRTCANCFFNGNGRRCLFYELACPVAEREETLTIRTGSKDPVTPTTPIDPARLGRRDRAKEAVMSGGLLGPKPEVKDRDVSSGVCQDTYVLSSSFSRLRSSTRVQIHQLRLTSGPHLLSFPFLVSRYGDTPLPLAFHQQVLTLRRGHGSSRNSVLRSIRR